MTDTPEQQHITCKTCGRTDVPDWGDGNCIACARDAVLGGFPEQRLEAALDEILLNLERGFVQILQPVFDGFTDNATNKPGALAAILAAIQQARGEWEKEAERYGRANEHFVISNILTNEDLGNLSPATTRRLKERKLELQPPAKEAKG